MKIKTVIGTLSSNTFVAEDNGTIIIIDAGAPVAAVQSVLGRQKPSAILLTHEHFDHILNIGDYCNTFDCPIYCHTATLNELKTNELNSFINFYGDEVKQPENFTQFKGLENDCNFQIGSIYIEAFITPGHSAGSIVYLINDILFTGDVLFCDNIGRTDLMNDGDELMQQTLRKVKEIKFITACHGHGANSTYAVQQKNILKHIK